MKMMHYMILIKNVKTGIELVSKKWINLIPDLIQKFVFFPIHLFLFIDVLIFFPFAFALILTCQLG